MVLRRLAQAVREQSWFTAIVEVAVVVVGIFIGLQVDDWNQNRLDRKDEQIFLNRLHDELMDATSVRAFIQNRRIAAWHDLRNLLDALYQPNDRDRLTNSECRTIYASHIKTANIAELPSFHTLLATGRLQIISDEALRSMLVLFSQRREAIEEFVNLGGFELASRYPEMFVIEPFFDTTGPVENLSARMTCDLGAMRQNRKFLHEFYSNADTYDSYIVSGLLPMRETVDALHELLDRNLGLDHD